MEDASREHQATPPSAAATARPTHARSNSFQRWRRQVQRAWRWGPAAGSREQRFKTTLNLEVLTHQKRQWYLQHQSKAKDHQQHEEPTALFEHFLIVGLHPNANVEAIEHSFARRKDWESEVEKSDILELRRLQHHRHPPALEPEILFKYPPGKGVEMREKDLPAFCFPEGVKARLLERTPSMSDLNEVVFGREHLARDGFAFIFSLKVSDNMTLYGVCLHVQEIVQRAPSILGVLSPLPRSFSKPSHFLVSAPRCYCILTRVPLFELHYEMLNSVIAQERLDRITQFVSEMTLTEASPQSVVERNQLDENFGYPDRHSCNNWMDYAIPVDSILGLTSVSAGHVLDKENRSFSSRVSEPHSPESISASDASDFGPLKELDKDGRRAWQHYDDFASEASESHSDSFERVSGNYEYGNTSPECTGMQYSLGYRLQRVASLESVYSSVKDVGSDDEDEKLCSKYEPYTADQKVMEWAKAQNNESLQIVCGYHTLPIPPWGSEIVFHPLEHLQPIKYCRPGLLNLGVDGASCDPETCCPSKANMVNARLAAAEEALALSLWTIATVCRALSLESILTLFAGALLEKQVAVICPNLGVLSATVLSLIPMIRPFEWQSLFLPVLPRKMFDFLDAPVPFIVGIQHKPTDVKMKTSNLVRIDVCKDQVKTCSLPPLPGYRELFIELSPIHARLTCENSIAKNHPVYKCSKVQAEAAGDFLNVTRRYLESLCSNLRTHTITNVQSNSDKVSLLLKDSFIDSFPNRDRPFIKLFVDTQLFSVLSDTRLSRYENE